MSEKSPKSSLSYKQAGVDIDAGNRFVDAIKPLVAATRRPGVLTDIGGFGGLFQLPQGLREPILVSGTDGVGTKLLLARMLERHDTIGIDLVAMCANDVLVQGAEPLFFLDYFACGRLDAAQATDVVRGISRGCQLAECALIGGETAEMPGMYDDGDYDLAGFCVGVVERDALVDGSAIEPDDVIVGLASSGPHSNGYSLIRRILDRAAPDLAMPLGDQTLAEALLAPTTLYVSAVKPCLAQLSVKGMAHITGGGLAENLARVLPPEVSAEVSLSAWTFPEVFQWLAENGPVTTDEMLRVFNCGIGYVLVVPEDEADKALGLAAEAGVAGSVIGKITPKKSDSEPVTLLS